MSQQLGECCVSGHLHEGTPKGTEKELYGRATYVTGEENAEKTIVFITDIFGYAFPNARLLADELAAGGFRVLVPDFFDGDAIDHALMPKIAPRATEPERSIVQKGLDTAKVAASLGPWVAKHRESVSRPRIESYVAEVRKDASVKNLFATGYCWGGRYSLLLADGKVDAAFAGHPSFLAVTDDFKEIKKPISIAVGDKDDMFPADQQKKAKAFFANELKDVPTEFVVFDGAVHGFNVRGDYSVDKDKQDKERATKQTLDWFKKYSS